MVCVSANVSVMLIYLSISIVGVCNGKKGTEL